MKTLDAHNRFPTDYQFELATYCRNNEFVTMWLFQHANAIGQFAKKISWVPLAGEMVL